jgi:hypothetical protein
MYLCTIQEYHVIRVIYKSIRDFRSLRYSSWDGHAEGEHVNRGKDTPKFLSYITGARYIHSWWHIEHLTNVSRTRSTVSADGPGRPVRFAVHRQTLCWTFMCHSRIVLSVGGSVWYMVRNVRCTVIIVSVLANSKTHNAFLFTVRNMCRHDFPLAVKPASTPRRLVHTKKLG